MDFGVVLGVINTTLLAAIGVIALFRWPQRRMFQVYAFVMSAASVVGAIWFYDYFFFLYKNAVGNLLALLFVVESWRQDVGGRPWWVLIALVPMALIPFAPIDYALRYQLPQIPLLIVCITMLPAALRVGSPILIGAGIYGVLALFGDSIALEQIISSLLGRHSLTPAIIVSIIRFVYPMFFLLQLGFWYHAILAPERIWLFRRLARRLLPEEVASESLTQKVEDLALRLDALEMSLETIGAVQATLSNKPYYTHSDIAHILGISEEEARRFVAECGIRRRHIPGTNSWGYEREAIDKVVMLNFRSLSRGMD